MSIRDEMVLEMGRRSTMHSVVQPQTIMPTIPVRQRSQARDDDVIIPTMQAGIEAAGWGAFVLYAIMLSIALVICLYYQRATQWWFWLLSGGGGAGIIALWLFAARVTKVFEARRNLWALTLGNDLDADEHVGLPPREVTRVEVVERAANGGARRIRYIDVPLCDDILSQLARAALPRADGGYGHEWSRRSLDNIIPAEVYKAVVTPMLAAGLLAYRGKGHNSGVRLTATGRAFLRQYMDAPPHQGGA